MQYIRGMRGAARLTAIGVFLIAVCVVTLSMGLATGMTSASGSSANLTVWDNTLLEGSGSIRKAGDSVRFHANYSNLTTGNPINDTAFPDASCNLSVLNWTGAWVWGGLKAMYYNTTSRLWEYNDTFAWKNTSALFNVSCSATGFDSLLTNDTFVINNTQPLVSGEASTFYCSEDTPCYYNFSLNVTEPDKNDILNYSSDARDPDKNFTAFTINSSTGIVTINATRNEDTGSFNSISLIVKDSDDVGGVIFKNFVVNPVNDAPVPDLSGCGSSVDENSSYACTVSATDEEGNIPFNYSSNTSWFNINDSNGSVNFIPYNQQVGTHRILISVNDSGGSVGTSVLTLTVNNINDPPSLDYACYNTATHNETNATEGSLLECWINATDIDVGNTLTFSSNASWFSLPSAAQSNDSRGSQYYSVNASFIVQDSSVGTSLVTFTVDDGSETSSKTVNITVFNTPDYPRIMNISNSTSFGIFEFSPFNLTLVGWDNDTLWNTTTDWQLSEYINFSHNRTDLFNLTYVNTTAIRISFLPSASDSGTHIIRINATDGTGNQNYSLINITIFNNSLPWAPKIYLSCYDTNESFNVSCQFNLSRNTTDPDGNVVTYSDNSTLFDVTSSEGFFNFTANDTVVGNHSILMTLTDDKGATNQTLMFLRIVNVSDRPSLALNNMQCIEDFPCSFNISANASDEDNNITGFTETLTFRSNATGNFINLSGAGVISFTPDFSNVGTYVLNISVNDSSNLSDSARVTLTVLDFNDPPILNSIGDLNATESVEFLFNISGYDEEGDYPLTFWSNLSWMSITRFNDTVSTINFTPETWRDGEYSVLITVNDTSGNEDSEVINFTVLGTNAAPQITFWYWNISHWNGTVLNTSSMTGTNATRLTASENSTVWFNASANDTDGDNVTYSWMINGTENSTSANFTWLAAMSGSNRSVNITYRVTDAQSEMSELTWLVSVVDINRPPEFIGNISNLSWAQDTTETINLSENFRDHDGNNLSFVLNLPSDCRVSSCMSASFTGTAGDYQAEFTPASSWFGVVNVTITANDSDYNVTSNNFYLNITYVPPQIQYVTVQSSGGSTSSTGVTRVASLAIIISPFNIIEENRVVEAPIMLKNTGKVTLNDIDLSALVDSDDLSLSLGQTSFDRIGVGDNETTSLTVTIVKPTLERYEINLNADGGNPGINETAVIYLETTPVNESDLETEIQFVKDLFEDNPECMELMELVFQAETALDQQDLDLARNLTRTSLDNCRDLIKYTKATGAIPSAGQPLIISLQPFEIALAIVGVIAAWAALSYFLRKRMKSKSFQAFRPPAQESGNTVE